MLNPGKMKITWIHLRVCVAIIRYGEHSLNLYMLHMYKALQNQVQGIKLFNKIMQEIQQGHHILNIFLALIL